MTFAGSLVLLASVCICSCYGSDITLWTSYDTSDNAGPGLDDTSSCNKTEIVTSGATLAPPYEDLTGCDTWTRVVTITDGYAIDVTVESMDVGQDDYLTINAEEVCAHLRGERVEKHIGKATLSAPDQEPSLVTTCSKALL
uniref:(California timema) hypothetical protein n=1 Tax=Timema californicum TaxID=61474 RepID=A0A7R9P3Y8_TIMCA|nr:unnamed protein product [Timema californicum]